MSTEHSALFKLGRAERLQLVEDLWDSIAREQLELPVSAAKRKELRRRKENFIRNPESGRTWDEVKRRARLRIA